MKHSYFFSLFSFLILCGGNAQKEKQEDHYSYKKASRDGISKWHKGRELAHVMGFQGINWLERNNREEEENTTTLLKNMNIRATDQIADIGAGSG